MILINKSASADVLKGLYTLLSTGQSLPVYDHVPEGADLPYITIEVMSERDFSTKTNFGSNVEVDITNYAYALESKTVQEVTGTVISLLKESDLSVEGYKVIGIDMSRNDCQAASVDNVYYGTLTIEVWVEEIPSVEASSETPGESDGQL